MGERLARMGRADRLHSRSAAGVANPGTVALIGGTLLFFVATWAHALGGMPAGFWRWIG